MKRIDYLKVLRCLVVGKRISIARSRSIAMVLALMVSVTTCACLLTGCNGQASSEEGENKVVSVYNFGDYIDPDVISDFETQSGYEVIYEEFDTCESMYSKIKEGGTSFDVLIPSDYMISKLINESMLQKIDYSKVPNMKNIDQKYLNKNFDSEQEYTVPYLWGTLGIVYNSNKVSAPDSWNVMWDSANAGRVFMMDSMRDTIGASLKRLGYGINTKSEDELNQAKDELVNQKNNGIVRAYKLDDVKDSMVGENADYAMCYSGEAFYINEENNAMKYIVPNEGSNIWFDCMVISKDAKAVEGAHAFINYMCDPEVALKNALYINYSTPNKEAFKKLPDELKNNDVLYPPDELIERCEPFVDLGEDVVAKYDELWTEIKVAG